MASILREPRYFPINPGLVQIKHSCELRLLPETEIPVYLVSSHLVLYVSVDDLLRAVAYQWKPWNIMGVESDLARNMDLPHS
jgi:hypothetical protein